MELRRLLEQYKGASLKLIDSLNNDDDNGELLVKKREELLEHLKESEFFKEELIAIANELELVQIEKKVMDAIMEARENVKGEIVKLKKKKEANRTYGTDFKNISFINKKI